MDYHEENEPIHCNMEVYNLIHRFILCYQYMKLIKLVDFDSLVDRHIAKNNYEYLIILIVNYIPLNEEYNFKKIYTNIPQFTYFLINAVCTKTTMF